MPHFHGSPEPSKPVQAPTNWTTLDDQPLTRASIENLFSNTIPSIRVANMLSTEECERLVDVIRTHKIGTYTSVATTGVGIVGITQYDHRHGLKEKYFANVTEARSLQERFARECGVDVMGRVCDALRKASGMPVRLAKEGDRGYFAGLLRAIETERPFLLHADYGPYQGTKWEIGHISAQISWNILFKDIQGGETIIYDRPWMQEDDSEYKKPNSYGYSPRIVEGHPFKVVTPTQGDIYFINSQNFHEVKAVDSAQTRYTISSFVGWLPASVTGDEDTLIVWS